MPNKSKTVHVIELHGQTKDLQNALNNLKKGFDGLVISPEIEKLFSKLDASIASILRKTEKGIIPRDEFSATEKEVGKIKSAFDSLVGSIESIQKAGDKKLLSMLPNDIVQKLQNAEKAYASYSQVLSQVVAAERSLQQAEEKKSEALKKAQGAEASARAYKGKVTSAEKEVAKHKAIIEALQEQQQATQALTKAQKELDDAISSGKGEKAISTRKEKVAKASSRKSAADAVVSGIDTKAIEASVAAQEKLSAATEKYTTAVKLAESAEQARTEAEIAAQTAANNLANAKKKNAEESRAEQAALNNLRSALVAVNPKYKELAIQGETTGEQLEFLKNIVDDLSTDELQKLKSSLGQINSPFEEFKDSVRQTGEQLQLIKEETKEADAAISQQEAFEGRIKQFLGLSGAAQVLRSALRDAMSTITELDATMTEMAVVTDLTVGDYWNQLPEYSKQASDLGVSINSAYKAATLYYQQGLKGNEVTKISAETLKMAKIAGLDTADATDKMTAALRGFNMELNETSAQRVSDVYSELAAITAADTKEIANAMTKTASIASSAGMEFETTAAFLSQIIETTRESAETAGTALKTVIARFQELKKDPSEIGEIDGEIVDANKIETALRSVGVALRDTSGQFRELDDVFLDLSSKWDGLDKNTQRYIATIAAGSRQQSRFIAMMSDYGRTQELVAAANNSAGASAKQFEKTQDSLASKIERLKNAWHEFTMGIMESDLVKFGVEILTKFLEVVNKATDGLGPNGVGGALTKIASVFAIFKTGMKIFNKFEAPIMSLYQKVTKWAGIEGAKAGAAYAKSAKDSAEKVMSKEDQSDNLEKNKKIDKKQKQEEKDRKRLENIRQGMTKRARGETHGFKDVPGMAKEGVSNAVGKISDKLLTSESKPLKEKVFSGLGFEQAQKSYSDAKQSRQNAQEAANNIVKYEQDQQNLTNRSIQVKQEREAFDRSNSGRIDELSKDEVTRKQQIASYEGRMRGGIVLNEGQIKLYEKAKKEQQELNNLRSKQQSLTKEQKKLDKELVDVSEKKEKAEATFNTETENYLTNQRKMWDDIGTGISAAGEKITGVGVAASMLGGIFDQLGLEGLGEAFSTVGQFATLFGTALTMLGPAVSMIGKVGTSVAAQLTSAGISTQAAWWWVVLIVAAVAALIAGIVVLFVHLNNNAPQKKLENAQKAADAAAESADQAAKKYDELNAALDDLSSKYDAMDEMVRGTDEWNKALQESNQAVLDLIDKYPELASLVKNVDGQLKLDTESDEVKEILNKYNASAVTSKGVALSAKAEVNKRQLDVEYSKLDESATIEHNNKAKEGWGAFGKSVGFGAAGGGLAGAATGAMIGGILGPIGALVGGGIGALIGGVAGAAGGAGVGTVAGTIASSMQESNKALGVSSEEEAREKTDKIAAAMASGEAGTTKEDLQNYLVEEMNIAADAAESVADRFWENADALREYGASVAEAEAANEAYYQAMATNAKQLINLDKYSIQEQSQMSTVVDSERMKAIEEQTKKEIQKIEDDDSSNNDEFQEKQEEFARKQYGEGARVEGDKIVDEKGETLREFDSESAWVEAIAAAEATEAAAEAMEAVPKAIDVATKRFGETVEKAFANPDKMTNEELQNFKASVGYDASEKGIEGSDGFTDKGREELQKLWNDNQETLSKIYGEGEEGFKTYLKEYRDIIEKQEEGWENIYKKADKLNFFSTNGDSKKALSKMSKEAANSWVNTVKKMNPTTVASGSQGDKRIDFLNEELNKFIAGMDSETVDLVMSEIGSIDITNAIEWDELAYRFEELGIVSDATEESLQGFIAAAKETSNAVVQVDFKTFNERINSTIVLLDKINEGARKYSKEDYQSFVAENSSLKDDFVQIGDEFVYLGNAMQDLEQAVRKNTVSQLQEANFVLGQKLGMSKILNDSTEAINTADASESEMRQWLVNTVGSFASEGLNIKNAGIEGLSVYSDFENADKETLKTWIDQLLKLKPQKEVLENEYEDFARDANVAAATLNPYEFNAKMAIEDKEFSDQYSDSLLAQAIQLGVGEVFLQAFSNAKETYNKSEKTDADVEAFKESVEDLLQAMYAAEELDDQEEAVNTIVPLVEKVIDTIEKQRQDEIDKLSEVNDSINTTNDRLVSKIQEQINSTRQQRQNDEMQQDLEDLYSKQAYLAMGGTSLEALENAELIKQTEQDVQDNLVDQALERLQDANEKAAEQRERQISLLQQQLDYDIKNGIIADEAAQIVKESLYQISQGITLSNTRLGEIVEDSLKTGGEWEKEQNNLDWGSKISEAVGGVTSKIANWLTSSSSKNNTSDNNSTPPGVAGSGNEVAEDWIKDVGTTGNEVVLGSSDGSKQDALEYEEEKIISKQAGQKMAVDWFFEASGLAKDNFSNLKAIKKGSVYREALYAFQAKGGSEESFQEAILGRLGEVDYNKLTGRAEGIVGNLDEANIIGDGNNWYSVPIKLGEETIFIAMPRSSDTWGGENSGKKLYEKYASSAAKNSLGNGERGEIAMYNGEPYIWDGAWLQIVGGHSNKISGINSGYDKLKKHLQNYLSTFKTGGLADFTGPAWLDGTKSRPEYILNADQTKRFFSLVDILERFDEKAGTSQKSGDNYFDINITVDKIENDYDVDKMADKIREKIYEDASYRNVNAINLIR